MNSATISTESEHGNIRNEFANYAGLECIGCGDFGLGKGAHGRQMGNREILSDTHGVDFEPYIQQVVLPHVRQNWYNAIPESEQSKLAS
jgi:hypothetical protein